MKLETFLVWLETLKNFGIEIRFNPEADKMCDEKKLVNCVSAVMDFVKISGSDFNPNNVNPQAIQRFKKILENSRGKQ